MGGFVSIFIVLAALVTMVGVMYLVLTEKHVDDAKINYVQSPYAAQRAKLEAQKAADAAEDAKPVETAFTPAEKPVVVEPDAATPNNAPAVIESVVTSAADHVDSAIADALIDAAAEEDRPD